jgi:hypothetical protein
MARIIPNNNTFIGFIPVANFNTTAFTGTYTKNGVSGVTYDPATWNSSYGQPQLSSADVLKAIDITPFVISLTAQTTGNTVPTPNLDSLFEGNIPGTVNSSFTMDMYRDDATYTDATTTNSVTAGDLTSANTGVDFAWAAFKRGQKGYLLISRFNSPATTTQSTNQRPSLNNIVEVWPVVVTAKTAGPITSNTVQTFTVTGAIPYEPAEYAKVAATVSALGLYPTAPLNLVGSAPANTGTQDSTVLTGVSKAASLALDWDTPAYGGSGGSALTYKVYYRSTDSNTISGATEITANVTFNGTALTLSATGVNLLGSAGATVYLFVTAITSTGSYETQTRGSNTVSVTLVA